MRAREFLSEGLKQDTAEQLVHEFVKFAADALELEQLPEIELQRDNRRSVLNRSFGGYGGHYINVTMTNRHIMDVCRTLAHELVHYRQDLRGELNGDNPGATGSPQENEANAQAAVIMRNWGKLHPELFAQEAIE